jgi:hypothetical protein
MVELVLVICLLGQPDSCAVERPAFQEPFPSIMACMHQATFRVAQWAEQHPRYSVRRWRCEMPQT